MILGLTLPQFMGLMLAVALAIWFIGPKIVSRLSEAHFREREESMKRRLKIAQGEGE